MMDGGVCGQLSNSPISDSRQRDNSLSFLVVDDDFPECQLTSAMLPTMWPGDYMNILVNWIY